MKKFKSEDAFRRNAAYVHIHNIPHTPQSKVEIAGKVKKIKHHDPDTCPYCITGVGH